ncbi:hypothetical protein FQA39_LY09702 [Lamprigera yunnana]|nr:hypothetical protein FQA39_LY09702 [Lamprigera yunnana]
MDATNKAYVDSAIRDNKRIMRAYVDMFTRDGEVAMRTHYTAYFDNANAEMMKIVEINSVHYAVERDINGIIANIIPSVVKTMVLELVRENDMLIADLKTRFDSFTLRVVNIQKVILAKIPGSNKIAVEESTKERDIIIDDLNFKSTIDKFVSVFNINSNYVSDPENAEAGELQRKLEMLNNIMDQEARAEQARRQMQYFGHSQATSNQFDNEISAGYSEDSDYTSDLNYPVGQHANSSASQFRSAAHQIHTPQRSLETSRENSCERDDTPGQHQLPSAYSHQQHLSPGHYQRFHGTSIQRYTSDTDEYGFNSSTKQPQPSQDYNLDSDPLFYNSRPPNYYKQDYSSSNTWSGCDNYNYNQKNLDRVDADYIEDPYYYNTETSPRKHKASRRPSLERQSTLYDESSLYNPNFYPKGKNSQILSYVQTNTQCYNQSYDKFFDATSYTSQEDRYGQDQEDRQWDSGGTNKKNSSKKLPSVPVVQNYLNKKRSSIVTQEIYQSCDGYLGSPTPKTRRRMPQIPPKRSASRQSSINDHESYDGYFASDNTSHRGASLPPTPTKTTKVLARIAANTKSLPPTPGRKLPQPNYSNHRSAKTRKNNFMKRTSSAEYPDYSNDDIYDDAYIRQGAISAKEVYNEDYNYAYQSIDNLPTDQQEEVTSAIDSDFRSSVTVNVCQNDTFPQYPQSTEEYYYSAQEERDYNTEQDYYEIKQKESTYKRKMMRGRVRSPLIQQNTDSLESRDDDLKDSFETATSSMSSSLPQQRRVPVFDLYSVTTPEIIVHNTTVITSPTSDENSLQASTFNIQYHRDQPEPVKAIPTLHGTNTTVPDVTITEPNNTTNQTIPFRNDSSRGFLLQQDSTILQHEESIDEDPNFNIPEMVEIVYPEKINEEPYLEQQESIESYVEEDLHDISADYTKAMSRDSPVSVIHITDDNISLRRGSSQITVVDPFHPSLQQRPLEPYAPISTRRPSVDPYRSTSPVRRTSGDAYSSASSLKATDDLFNRQRKNSIDPYQQGAPRRASVRHSPVPIEYTAHEDVVIPLEDEQLDEKDIEDVDIKPARPQVTAQQRWHWAYNKIIMQLNVSTIR